MLKLLCLLLSSDFVITERHIPEAPIVSFTITDRIIVAEPTIMEPPLVPLPIVQIWTMSNCRPCAAMKIAIDKGELFGCNLQYMKTASPTGRYPCLQVLGKTFNGWASDTAKQIRIAAGVSPTAQLKKTVSHNDMVALHNKLHGGGSWTWPGDLKEHLATIHHVEIQ